MNSLNTSQIISYYVYDYFTGGSSPHELITVTVCDYTVRYF